MENTVSYFIYINFVFRVRLYLFLFFQIEIYFFEYQDKIFFKEGTLRAHIKFKYIENRPIVLFGSVNTSNRYK